MVEQSDSSHSGIVVGMNRWYFVGLVGAEDAKNGKLNEEIDCLLNDSQLKLLGLGTFEIGDESGGVTGALFEIRKGGSDDGIAFWRYANGFLFMSRFDGLGNDEDDGLHWYEGIGLWNEEEAGLGFWDEHGVVFVDVPPVSIVGNGGLEPCH